MTDAESLEETDDGEAEMVVVDPEEYHESQRLREIHQARRQVTNVLQEIEAVGSTSDTLRQKGDLAIAVSAYYAELQPLIIANDASPLELPDSHPWDTVREYGAHMGLVGDGEHAEYQVSMYVFRQLNQLLADAKPLIKPDESTEWEV
jgi:hypothetical protein